MLQINDCDTFFGNYQNSTWLSLIFQCNRYAGNLMNFFRITNIHFTLYRNLTNDILLEN